MNILLMYNSKNCGRKCKKHQCEFQEAKTLKTKNNFQE